MTIPASEATFRMSSDINQDDYQEGLPLGTRGGHARAPPLPARRRVRDQGVADAQRLRPGAPIQRPAPARSDDRRRAGRAVHGGRGAAARRRPWRRRAAAAGRRRGAPAGRRHPAASGLRVKGDFIASACPSRRARTSWGWRSSRSPPRSRSRRASGSCGRWPGSATRATSRKWAASPSRVRSTRPGRATRRPAPNLHVSAGQPRRRSPLRRHRFSRPSHAGPIGGR